MINTFKMNQEQIIRIQLMEQEVDNLNKQIQLIDQNILDLNDTVSGMDELEVNKEIFVDLGKRIYIPVKINDNKLMVDVGKGNFVKKNIPETKKVINEQIEKLNIVKNQILNRLNELHKEMNSIILEIEREQKNIEKRKSQKSD